jgi:hypothetical protein
MLGLLNLLWAVSLLVGPVWSLELTNIEDQLKV